MPSSLRKQPIWQQRICIIARILRIQKGLNDIRISDKKTKKVMSQKNLKQKAVSGMIWTALQRYSTMLIQFISGIILARLLTPYDYGCIGMLTIFMILAEWK